MRQPQIVKEKPPPPEPDEILLHNPAPPSCIRKCTSGGERWPHVHSFTASLAADRGGPIV